MAEYILIRPDDDGNPIMFLHNENALEDFLSETNEYGVDRFLDTIPKQEDPNYWDTGTAILAEIKILKLKTVATAFKIGRD